MSAESIISLADIVRDLRRYDEAPVDWQEPTIYAAEPWTVRSEAIVSWSMPKGGLPDNAAKRRLVRLIEVRAAIRLLEDRYDQLHAAGRSDELGALLIARVQEQIRLGNPYVYNKGERKETKETKDK